MKAIKQRFEIVDRAPAISAELFSMRAIVGSQLYDGPIRSLMIFRRSVEPLALKSPTGQHHGQFV
jgi:hypothetical protein